ncbi:hypothetical protein PInf_019415 [Phytophthora infestans]|nr:hypothetical protein PInf_019415 [Phytophthora infestans]
MVAYHAVFCNTDSGRTDCLKCYDRIPAWVIELIYLGLGVPDTVKKLMIDLLGPGEIEVRASFGWIATGEREFGIGQGSILAILHIGVYMDAYKSSSRNA